MFANGTVVAYLPISGNAGSSLWGTDVRLLLGSAEASSQSTSIANCGTGGSVTRTFDPYSTTTADLDQSLYGWAITPADMGSVTGALRMMPAGTHSLFGGVRNNTSPLGKSVQIVMDAYRVGPAAGRTRTLLGSVTSAPFNTGNANAVVNFQLDLSLSEIVFENDETIQYAFEIIASGTAITGETYSFRTGHSTAEPLDHRITFPGLKTIAHGDGAAAGLADAAGVTTWFAGGAGSADGIASASGVASWVASGVGDASGAADAQGVGAWTFAAEGVADGVATADGIATGIISVEGQADGVATADAVATAIFSGVGDAQGLAVVVGEANWIFSGVGSADGLAVADGLMSSVAGAVGAADGLGEALGLMSIVLGMVGTVDIGGEGGGGTTVIPVFNNYE